MKVLSNADIIRIVNKWQKAGFVGVMTCAADGCKTDLEPIERKGEVILKCPACVYEESMIPSVVLNSEARIDGVARFQSSKQSIKRARRQKDLLFKVLACALCAVVIGSLMHPLYGTTIGLLLGVLIIWYEFRRHP